MDGSRLDSERRLEERRLNKRRETAFAIARARYPKLALQRYEPLQKLIKSYKGEITDLVINGGYETGLDLAFARIAGVGWQKVPRDKWAFATTAWAENMSQSIAAAFKIAFNPNVLPRVAARLPDGNRYNATHGQSAGVGFVIAIRVPRMVEAEPVDFLISQEVWDRICEAIADAKPVWVSGGTGSGKTTLAARMIKEIPRSFRIATVEDTPELEGQIPHENVANYRVTRSETTIKYDWNDAIDDVLRGNPDAFLVGEVAIPSAAATIQCMDTGHGNFMTTMHANSPMDAIRGFRRRVALAGGHVDAFKEFADYIRENVGLIIQVQHVKDVDGPGRDRRMVTDVVAPEQLLSDQSNKAAINSGNGPVELTAEEHMLLAIKKLKREL